MNFQKNRLAIMALITFFSASINIKPAHSSDSKDNNHKSYYETATYQLRLHAMINQNIAFWQEKIIHNAEHPNYHNVDLMEQYLELPTATATQKWHLRSIIDHIESRYIRKYDRLNWNIYWVNRPPLSVEMNG